MAKKNRGRNEGSLFKLKNGNWRAQVSLEGERPSFSSKSKSECQAWLNKMNYNLDRGLDYHGGGISLADYLYQWLETIKPTIRDTTIFSYTYTINRHIVPRIGNTRVRDLTLMGIEMYYASLTKAGVGERTVKIVNTVLRRSLDKAVRYGIITSNPAIGAALPRVRTAEMKVWDITQIGQFLVAAINSPWSAFFYVAVTTGMRQGELFGLKWSDLSWTEGTLHVQRQVQRIIGKKSEFVEPKTKSGRRVIKLGESTLQTLRMHKERQEVQKLVVGARWKDNDLIFPTAVGTPGDAGNIRKEFKRVIKEAGLAEIRFHDLRHSAASLLLNNNVPLIVISRMLGHSRPSTTLDIYGHLYHESQNEAAKLMDKLVAPIPMSMMMNSDQLQEGDMLTNSNQKDLHQSAHRKEEPT